MAVARDLAFLCGFLLLLLSLSAPCAADATENGEFVLTLDASNFNETISKHPFIVVEFYAPWCGHCKNLAPEYEKAASALRNHDPPIVLAKVDVNDEHNNDLAIEYGVKGFPTLKILRDGGKSIQDYKGSRDANGIIGYLKKQVGPASVEIRSVEDAHNLISDKNVFVVGVFPEFSGEEFQNFIALAEKLRAEYSFGHTLNVGFLPRGESSVSLPIIRLFKPFDELFVDFQDFHEDAMEKFIEGASMPIVTIFDKDPANFPFVNKFFQRPHAKAMLFLNFSGKQFEAIKSAYHDAAVPYKGKAINFLLGDIETKKGALEYFGVKDNQVPAILIQNTDGQKYVKVNLEPNHITPWLKEYMGGTLKPFKKSEPIPEVNNEPVKVVVADNLDDVVFNSRKNVLLEFYAPWCGHCQKLAPILDQVALSFNNDPDVVVAKIDATANDFPMDTFEVKGFPTLYFLSSSGKIVKYDSSRAEEDIIDFIQKNRDTPLQSEPAKDEL